MNEAAILTVIDEKRPDQDTNANKSILRRGSTRAYPMASTRSI